MSKIPSAEYIPQPEKPRLIQQLELIGDPVYDAKRMAGPVTEILQNKYEVWREKMENLSFRAQSSPNSSEYDEELGVLGREAQDLLVMFNDIGTHVEERRISPTELGSAYERMERVLVHNHLKKYDSDENYKARVMDFLQRFGAVINDAQENQKEIPEPEFQEFVLEAQQIEGSTYN